MPKHVRLALQAAGILLAIVAILMMRPQGLFALKVRK